MTRSEKGACINEKWWEEGGGGVGAAEEKKCVCGGGVVGEKFWKGLVEGGG